MSEQPTLPFEEPLEDFEPLPFEDEGNEDG
jgi:hypothetical protein